MLKEGRGSYKMAFKEGDFIEIEYTGAIKESGIVFDTTSIDVAKKNNLYDTHKEYGPIIICLGHEQLLKGLDQQIRDKELNKDYKIEVKAEKTNSKAVISIRDQGVGIPKDQQKTIFEKFQRSATAKNFEGLGIGLYISNQIIQAQQGSIKVKSKPGKGSVFIVKLPLKPSLQALSE